MAEENGKENGNGVTKTKLDYQQKELDRQGAEIESLRSTLFSMRTELAAMRERQTLLAGGLAAFSTIAAMIAAYLK